MFAINRRYLPFEGEKFIGFGPTSVWRRCNIDIGFEASLADDERFLVTGPRSSRCLDVDMALEKN